MANRYQRQRKGIILLAGRKKLVHPFSPLLKTGAESVNLIHTKNRRVSMNHQVGTGLEND